MTKELSPELMAMKAAEKSYRDAKRDYDALVRKAESGVSDARRIHDKAVLDVENQLTRETKSFQKATDVFSNARLYPDHVEYGKSSIALEEGMSIEVNASGNVYATTATKGKVGVSLGGAVLGGVVAGPLGVAIGGKKNKVSTQSTVHDGRNLFIGLKTSTNAMTIQCDPTKEKEARDFADRITEAAANVSDNIASHRQRLAALRQETEVERRNTKAIEIAEQNLEDRKSQTDDLEAAAKALDTARNAVPAADMESYVSTRKRRNIIIAAIATAVVLAVVVIAVCIYYF